MKLVLSDPLSMRNINGWKRKKQPKTWFSNKKTSKNEWNKNVKERENRTRRESKKKKRQKEKEIRQQSSISARERGNKKWTNEQTPMLEYIRGEISPNAETTTPKLYSSRFRTNGVPKNAAWLDWILARTSRNTAKRREIDDYYTLGFFLWTEIRDHINTRQFRHSACVAFLDHAAADNGDGAAVTIPKPSIEHRRSRYFNEINLNG